MFTNLSWLLFYRGTLGGCYATSLGAALHEIGHIFDLVHSDCGIMARGFNELDLFFTVGNFHSKFPKSTVSTSFLIYESNSELKFKLSVVESIGKQYCQEISIRARTPTKVKSVSFGFQSNGNDKKSGQDGQAYFHRSAAVLLSGHP